MKKIAMTLLLGYSISFSSDCVKMQIDELRYMKKEELVDSYKTQTAFAYIGELGHLNRKHLDSLFKNIF